jgi:hypothetical protein
MTANAHLSSDSMRPTGVIQLGASVATRLRGSGSGARAVERIGRSVDDGAGLSRQYQWFAGKGADIVKRGRRP